MNAHTDIERFLVIRDTPLRTVMKVIDEAREGIALVVDEEGKLIGTITDGDIRRFIIANGSLDENAEKVMYHNPLAVGLNTSTEEIRQTLKRYRIRNLPLVDEQGCPRKLVNLRDLIENGRKETIAVVMAGGEGRRLRPLTDEVPKPMIKVGDKPVLETIVEKLAAAGIMQIYISVNYKADTIEKYFQDGRAFHVRIQYLKEEGKKLGTAGSLALLPRVPKDPFLVINGDVITDIDLRNLLDFHQDHRCVMTIGAVRYRFNVPYGVLRLAGHYVLSVEEKPRQQFFCSAGMYALNPEVLRFLPKGESPMDMTELMEKAVNAGLPVGAFPIHERWIDIGKMEDLDRARALFGGSQIKECGEMQ
ncbi:MAG: nucleotidyltransferase family protein [Deltaproteobacteria bacterium]|nr:nucleotidyltransferase family protein [Deltaproteobacteria bacterium]MBW1924265.1 nucleotidyltransferase family protein [Deltaproteobacteria bacterium]MBW2008855.1 nucleotidyltransferase family protein [Deltaproteobacteria bacterium]